MKKISATILDAIGDTPMVRINRITKDVKATVNVVSSTGQTVYTGTFNINSGTHNFVWDGKGNDGIQWPDGNYKLSIVAKDAAGETTTVDTDAVGTVDSVDLTSAPPLLTIGNQTFTVDQIKRVIRTGS